MPPKRKKTQARLTFEPVASSSSPAQDRSPAKVRFSAGANTSSPSRSSPRAPLSSTFKGTSSRKRRPAPKQSALEDSPNIPTSSFMPRSHGGRQHVIGRDSSDDSADEVDDAGYDEHDVDFLPPLREMGQLEAPTVHIAKGDGSDNGHDEEEEEDDDIVASSSRRLRSSQSVSTRLQRTAIDDEEDDDDAPIAPGSSLKRRRPAIIELDDDDDDSNEDDQPVIPAASASKRSHPVMVELEDSSDDSDLLSPMKKRKTFHLSSSNKTRQQDSDTSETIPTPGRLKKSNDLLPSSPTRRASHKGHRSEKQKKMELLRRRRAGEKNDRLTSSESEADNEDPRGIYDTDPEDELQVLKEFDDDDEEPETEEEKAPPQKTPRRRKEKEIARREDNEHDDGEGGDNDSDLDGFIAEDDDGPLGAPAYLDIPLEFTAQAHKPLKEQFPYVIEWLVHNRINPAFDRHDAVYRNAWRKLDGEVRGLASSKFTSSAWKEGFHRALKGRPKLESYELQKGDINRALETCEACGRSGHPATWLIKFEGHAYHKDTLDDVESDSGSEDEEEDGHNDRASVDSQGISLPPLSKEWYVGAVCCSNAETAHSLTHWKYALKEWVEERLEADGWMTGPKLREREKMKARKRRELANGIVDSWQGQGIVAALYRDFKNTLEEARNKATNGRGLIRGRR